MSKMTYSEAGKIGAANSLARGTHMALVRQKKMQEEYNSKPKCCLTCSSIIPYEKRRNRFCSHSCAASHNNLRVAHNPKKSKRQSNCLYCGRPNKSGIKFCSAQCSSKFAYADYIAKWLAGENDGRGKDGEIFHYIRRYLRETVGDKCERCGWNEVHPITGRVPVQIEHIDGDASNNRRENLRLLCPNCHSLTPTFGNLNAGKGRAWRREKYIRVR